jgi:hypothetical protein
MLMPLLPLVGFVSPALRRGGADGKSLIRVIRTAARALGAEAC